MKYRTLIQTATIAVAVSIAAPVAFASDEGKPTPAVMTDTAPLPAQDRGSQGAIILQDSMVLAQREAFQKANERTGLGTVGRNALRATLRAQTQAELAQARQQEALRFYERGASTLDGK